MSKEKHNDIIQKYLSDYPNLPNLTLAKIIYKDNKLLFKDVDTVRSTIRYYRGAKGKKNLANIKTDKFITPENRIKKYNLPESIETDYQPYLMAGNKGLIFSDIHIPFHSISSLETMFDYTIKMNLDFILLNGDIMDMFDISHFTHEPDLIKIKDEFELTKKFLIELKRIYSKAKIYFKAGNHEQRWETYLMNKAPEIFGMKQFKLEILLDLYNMKIEYISGDRYIDLSGLYIYHGSEFRNGITSPANPARTAFLRSKDCSIVGHYHQSSEHTEKSINDKIITCWSLGCLCDLHPLYMPLNKWGHGFAIYERHDNNFWTVENKRIVMNKVV